MSTNWEWFPDKDYPDFKHLQSIDVQLATQPTVLVIEATIIGMAALTLVHALLTSRKLVCVWVAAIVSGTMNDIIFMVLPFVDNFWHAQMTVMITPRLPLYIPCAYAVFQYVGVVAGCKFRGNGLQMSCVAGLLSALFYSIYDLVGAKFLSWTWHTTDAATLLRWCGVPIGSTMWTLVHVTVFSFILHRTVLNSKGGMGDLIKGVVATSLGCTPCMMVMMAPFQMHQLRLEIDWEAANPNSWVKFDESQFPGRPDSNAISLCIATLMLATKAKMEGKDLTRARWGRMGIEVVRVRLWDRVLYAFIALYFVVLAAVMQMGDPSAVKATGLHQTIGDCDVKGWDLSGYERRQYLCYKPRHDEFEQHNQYGNVNNLTFGKTQTAADGKTSFVIDHRVSQGACAVESSYGISMAETCGWSKSVVSDARDIYEFILSKTKGDGSVQLDLGCKPEEAEANAGMTEALKSLSLLAQEGSGVDDANVRKFLASCYDEHVGAKRDVMLRMLEE
ncbi:hypothetical protein TeGR_g11448 [Tetraparma gracilis]|uniref:DUF7802 domain-containing protein n=1 Tax=Tetraparma gracilis TaxID=2962635 RepID=A0ABQ6N8M1_9STRA|nr:hypothetical protein TeGR_g11448 [Tetraparma gracilis]